MTVQQVIDELTLLCHEGHAQDEVLVVTDMQIRKPKIKLEGNTVLIGTGEE